MIINVKEMVEKEKEILKERVNSLKNIGKNPKLAVILASNDKASKIYVGKKRDLCAEIGIEEVEFIYDNSVTEEALILKIKELNNDDSVSGILVQLPLFKHLDSNTVINSIATKKDVDGLTSNNAGKLSMGLECIIPCTPKGIMMVLDRLNVDIASKNVVVVGRSNLVGKPIAQLLLNRNATVTICHSKTANLKEYTLKADILIVACGITKLITEDMIKNDSVVIDVGINRADDGKIYGDCDTLSIQDKVKFITPVPSGIGLTTVISLMSNVIDACNL